jgi:hypothetical protein
MLLAYNLIRREATRAAEKHKKAATEISFKFAFQFIATEMIVLGNTASSGTIPKRLEHLRGNLEAVFITKRPRPSRPRAVKMSKTRYPVKRNTALLKRMALTIRGHYQQDKLSRTVFTQIVLNLSRSSTLV